MSVLGPDPLLEAYFGLLCWSCSHRAVATAV